MPEHVIAWPVLLYVGAALLLPRLRTRLDRHVLTLALMVAAVLAYGAMLLVAAQGPSAAEPWLFSRWGALATIPLTLSLHATPTALPFLLLTGLAGVATFVGSLDDSTEGSSEDYQAGLLAILAGVAAIALAGNLFTLLVAGFLLDLGILFGLGFAGRPRWFLVAVVQSALVTVLLLAASLVAGREVGATGWAALPARAVELATLAAIVRMAPLPFSLFPVAFERLPQRVMALLPLATLGVGGLMLAQLAQAGVDPALSATLAPIAALGVALAGWVAWRGQETSEQLVMLGAGQAAWALWAFAMGLPSVAVAVAWGGSLALGALALHGGHMDFRHGTQLPGLIAVLMIAGMPGSALWGAATLLGGHAWATGQFWLLTLALIGVMGSTAALLAWLFSGEEERHQPSRWTGVALLALLSVPFIGVLWGIQPPALPEATLAAAPLVAQLAVPLLGWAGGLWLWRTRELLAPLHPLLDGTATLFSFVWLWRVVGRIGWLLLRGLRGIVLVLEGENYGWLLLFAFVTLLFLLQ